MTEQGLTIADVLALQDKDDGGGFMGGNGMWIFFLFFLLAWGNGGGGLFGGGNAANANMNQITNDFLYTNLGSQIRDSFSQTADGLREISQGLCQGFSSTNMSMMQGFNNLGNGICNLGYQMSQCCCETNRNIDAVRAENYRNTCEIVNAVRSDGDATRALINSNTMQELRDNLQAAQLALSNANQTQNILSSLGTYQPYGCCASPCGC